MEDKITRNAPYFRTVPSSPEPDEDEILLPGEEDIIEEEEKMSPAGLPEKIMAQTIGGENTKEKSKNEEVEDDEEAILRRRLLEKKKEKEEKQESKKSSTSSNRNEPTKSSAVGGGREKEKQERKNAPTTANNPPKKEREKIVWKKEPEKVSSTSAKIQEKYSTAAGRKEEKREKEKKHGNEKQQNMQPSSSKTSSKLKIEEEPAKKSTEYKSSSSSKEKERHHHRREKMEMDKNKREEGGTKKRHREKSDSREEGRDGRKTMKKDEKKIHPPTPEPEKESMMEEVSPMEEDKPTEEALKVESTANKPKKYSKFESSPEQSDEEKEGMGAKEDDAEIYSDNEQTAEFGMEVDGVKTNLGMDGNEADMDVLDDDLLENKEFDKLTETEKAILSPEKLKQMEMQHQKKLISRLPVYYPGISGCRSVVEYECLNKISEGTFGVVYRAQERRTDEIVALKRLKMEKEQQGFPITSLREINMLLKCGTHPNVLNVREVVVGSSMDKIYMVMEYVEHDMKSLMELMKSRNKKWTISQVKTLMRQLLSGVEHMHEEYVIHRDLKTSNLLISHQGILKIGDFGLAREFGEPIKPYTPIVVTLWYRSPELLLGTKIYSTAVDNWSVGCIFGEFLKLDPMFAGRTEIEQLQKIFKEVGTPNEQIWPGCMELPGMKTGVFPETPYNQLRRKFASELPDDDGYELLNKLLALDPKKRISASSALKSKWFQNDPKPTPPSSFPTWPAKSEHNKKLPNEPAAPRKQPAPGGFTLKFDVPKF